MLTMLHDPTSPSISNDTVEILENLINQIHSVGFVEVFKSMLNNKG